MAKKRNDYFQLIEQQLACCVNASDYLCEVLGAYSEDRVEEFKEKMHEIEHSADQIHHHILTQLTVEFMTPIDQEDILRLVQIVDDITDALDEVVLDLYMYHAKKIPTAAIDFAKEVNLCVKALHRASTELKNFKKPEKLRELLVEVNDIEGYADKIYVQAVHDLFAEETDVKTLLGTKVIYESLENCCDLCEHAADVIEQIVIKNT